VPKRGQQIILDAVARQLTHHPDERTTRRKLRKENLIAPWELRVGDFRVFYDVQHELEAVAIVAVGKKIHDRLTIGGEEIEL
jgi:mRNA-degrading endonuclease RelE of RelBE toxin-antitoxin system